MVGQGITVIIRIMDTLEAQDLEDQEDTRMNLEGPRVGGCIRRVGMGGVITEDLEGREALVDLKAGLVGLGGMVDSMEDQEGLAGLDERFSELIRCRYTQDRI